VRRLRAPDVMDFHFGAYAALVLLWPFAGTRFWLPVLPLLLGYLSDGVDGLGRLTEAWPRLGRWRWLARADAAAARVRGPLLVLGAAALLGMGVVADVRRVRARWRHARDVVGNVLLEESRRDVARFLARPPRKPVVLATVRHLEFAPAFRDPQVAAVRMPCPPDGEPEALLLALEQAGLTHVALEHGLRRGSLPARWQAPMERLIAAHPGRFRRVERTKFASIYEVIPRSEGR
jgi:hypothetical protein